MHKSDGAKHVVPNERKRSVASSGPCSTKFTGRCSMSMANSENSPVHECGADCLRGRDVWSGRSTSIVRIHIERLQRCTNSRNLSFDVSAASRSMCTKHERIRIALAKHSTQQWCAFCPFFVVLRDVHGHSPVMIRLCLRFSLIFDEKVMCPPNTSI